jgi:hypothetical protein
VSELILCAKRAYPFSHVDGHSTKGARKPNWFHGRHS